MRIDNHRQWLEQAIRNVRIPAPPDTILGEAGGIARSMVHAYLQDGGIFFFKGDSVNGLASYGYAEGWLDAAQYLGLLAGVPSSAPTVPLEPVNGEDERLGEKTERYHRLLQEGLEVLEPAPDRESVLWKGACHVLVKAQAALSRGEASDLAGRRAEALRWYSYGHGWLDVGVRSGIFRILGKRDIFTI